MPPLRQMALLVFAAVAVAEACFITNCPHGGRKRAVSSRSSLRLRQCLPCGPVNGDGRCFGPDLCCGPGIGCYKNTLETRACAAENESPFACRNDAAACRAVERGQCVTNGYCCNDSGACKSDDACQMDDVGVDASRPEVGLVDILNSIQRQRSDRVMPY